MLAALSRCSERTLKAPLHYSQNTSVMLSVMRDDTEVTLKRDPKTDGLRRATQKANMRCVSVMKRLKAADATCREVR